MKLTLKKLSHNARMSEETYCFSAVVCIDGVPAFEVLNRGHGGCDEHNPIGKGPDHAAHYAAMRAAVQRCEDYAASLPGEEFHGKTLKKDLDWLVADLVTEALREKHKAKFLKLRFLAVHILEGEELLTIKMKPGFTVTSDVIRQMAAKYPNGKILNTLPSNEAWEIAKKFY